MEHRQKGRTVGYTIEDYRRDRARGIYDNRPPDEHVILTVLDKIARAHLLKELVQLTPRGSEGSLLEEQLYARWELAGEKIRKLTLEERLQLLETLTPDQRLAGLPAEQIEAHLRPGARVRPPRPKRSRGRKSDTSRRANSNKDRLTPHPRPSALAPRPSHGLPARLPRRPASHVGRTKA